MTTLERRLVQVWFGSHVIATYVAQRPLADQYAAAMSRRFTGLRITNEPLPPSAAGDPHNVPDHPPIPPEQRLWPLTVF
ncbi:hypothetical protein [Kribbella sp. VKM Ac-2566]|uniref:hypothetical protein n=1 Tax=Kribbella sp. VKM Ac-2566 TaxID=2512218 RepID=UPI001063FCBC|nr:hypothetical protein [Kribbella sp. VKM Ac-2566]TDX03812.1 hypothetical protein EV647_2058 [Kribbella sp. VKM Ac-2566]